MRQFKGLAAVLAGAMMVATAGAANATIFTFDETPPSQGGRGGTHLGSISGSYNTQSEAFTWNYTQSGTLSDGFWLVVSDGVNPKNNIAEYAILYGDTQANRISAFTYSGKNSADSFKNPGEFIASYDNILSITDGGQSVSFTLDASEINAFTPTALGSTDWDGIIVDEHIGWWFHTSIGSEFTYSDAGVLTDYSFHAQNWSDVAKRNTTPQDPPTSASAPAGMAVLGLALLAFYRRRAA